MNISLIGENEWVMQSGLDSVVKLIVLQLSSSQQQARLLELQSMQAAELSKQNCTAKLGTVSIHIGLDNYHRLLPS